MLSSALLRDRTSYHSVGKLLSPCFVASFMFYDFMSHYLFLDNDILRGFPELGNAITRIAAGCVRTGSQ